MHTINIKLIREILYIISKSDVSHLQHISIQASHMPSTPQPHVASSNHTEQHRSRGQNERKEENKGNEEKGRRQGHPFFHDHFQVTRAHYFIRQHALLPGIISCWGKSLLISEKNIYVYKSLLVINTSSTLSIILHGSP